MLQGHEVVNGDNVHVSRCGDENVDLVDNALKLGDLVTIHGGLEGQDGVNLRDNHASALAAQGFTRTLADIAITTDKGDLAAHESVGGAVQTIDQRVTNAVLVIKLRLRDRVVDVDSREEKLALFEELVEAVNTSRGLLGDAHDLRGNLGEAGRSFLEAATQNVEDDLPFGGILGRGLWHNASLFELNTLVDEHGGVSAIIKNHVGARGTIGTPVKDLLGAPPVLFEGFAFPGKDRGSRRVLWGSMPHDNGCCRLILGRENVAACPTNLSAQCHQGLNEDRGLHGHVK